MLSIDKYKKELVSDTIYPINQGFFKITNNRLYFSNDSINWVLINEIYTFDDIDITIKSLFLLLNMLNIIKNGVL